MLGTNYPTNEKRNFYHKMVQAILRGGVDYDTNVGFMSACFVYMGDTVKTQLENGLEKL